MSYQAIYDRMRQQIDEGREFPDALHDAAIEVERAGLMSYPEADEALTMDYDNDDY